VRITWPILISLGTRASRYPPPDVDRLSHRLRIERGEVRQRLEAVFSLCRQHSFNAKNKIEITCRYRRLLRNNICSEIATGALPLHHGPDDIGRQARSSDHT
jgi:hypothetical protein